VKITPDTNILLRAVLGDHETQSRAALDVLERAELVAISTQALCEIVWALKKGYGVARRDIVDTIRRIVDAENAVLDRPAVEAGLSVLAEGGDFADGVIAYEGQWRGGETFVSFDKQAVSLISARGSPARLLA
jgi:predicted nucleic-acid-binding protein